MCNINAKLNVYNFSRYIHRDKSYHFLFSILILRWGKPCHAWVGDLLAVTSWHGWTDFLVSGLMLNRSDDKKLYIKKRILQLIMLKIVIRLQHFD